MYQTCPRYPRRQIAGPHDFGQILPVRTPIKLVIIWDYHEFMGVPPMSADLEEVRRYILASTAHLQDGKGQMDVP